MADQSELSKQFQSAKRKSLIINTVALIFAITLGSIVYMITQGDRYSDILSLIGLSGFYRSGGVYADCSRSENHNNPFCQKHETKSDKAWKDLRTGKERAVPFGLTNDR